jgi:hypothetical protein
LWVGPRSAKDDPANSNLLQQHQCAGRLWGGVNARDLTIRRAPHEVAPPMQTAPEQTTVAADSSARTTPQSRSVGVLFSVFAILSRATAMARTFSDLMSFPTRVHFRWRACASNGRKPRRRGIAIRDKQNLREERRMSFVRTRSSRRLTSRATTRLSYPNLICRAGILSQRTSGPVFSRILPSMPRGDATPSVVCLR